MTTTHQIVSQAPEPPMVWLFTDERTPAVRELLGKDAEAFLDGLPPTQNEPHEEARENTGA